MKKVVLYIVVLSLFYSCDEELIPKPNNLISEEKMADIIQEMAIVNASKTTNAAVLSKSDIDPTEYVLAKYSVDSLQYVESDRYYVSKPLKYEKIFKIVEIRLEADAKILSDAKKQKDSIRLEKQKADAQKLREKKRVKQDSLP